MARSVFVLFLTLGLASSVRAQKPAFTIEQILSAPFPSSLTAAPEGQRVAWVFSQAGVTNIWVAEGPEFSARQLTQYDQDDGRSLTIVGFTHDGARLVFVKRGRFNPTHDLDGAPGDRLFVADWQGGDPREIARVGGGAVAPRSDAIAYVDEGKLHIVSLTAPSQKETDEDSKIPAETVTVRGHLGGLVWSPDGTKIAFHSVRESNGHDFGFVVLYDRETKTIAYLDPSVYTDVFPQFSPDGSKLAFIRHLRDDRGSVLGARSYPSPDPWEIRVIDLATQKGVTAWRSPEDDSSEYASVAWLNDTHLVFVSEQSGWRQLYVVGDDASDVRQLSQAPGIVENFVAHPETETVFFVSNAGDIDRRHLFQSGVDGRVRQLTDGQGIQWSPAPTGDHTHLVFIGSDAIHPARPMITDLDDIAPRPLAPEAIPEDFPVDELVTPEQVIFHAADGTAIHGQLFLPPREFKGRRPAVLFFHGGPMRQMLLGWHYSGYYHRCYAMNQVLASRGFVVLSVNYRLGIGYGRAFRDVPDGGPRGASEYQDLLAGARFLRSHDRVDGDRMGLWGGSYGGLMTALGLARNSDLFAAGVDLHGVHDWNQWQSAVFNRPNDGDRTVWKSSPIADLSSWRSPVLLIHGDDDRNVPFSETVWLARELDKMKVDYELLVFPDDVHSFLLHRNWVKAYQAAADFFERKLN